MKLVCERDALDRALHFVVSRARGKLKIPILQHVKLQTEGASLKLTATDMDTRSDATCGAEVAAAGATTVAADRLSVLVAGMPKGAQVSIEQHGIDLHVHCGRSRYRLPTLPAADFPAMSEPRNPIEFSLGCLDVRALFTETAQPIRVDGSRLMLEGGCLHQPEAEQVAVVATDGVRLVRRVLPAGIQFERRYIVPKAAMAEIVKLASDGELLFRCGENLIEVTAGNRMFTSKLIEAEYPDIMRAIPLEEPQYIAVDRAEFIAAFKRLVGLQVEHSTIDMHWREGDAALTMSLSGEGSGQESVACECALPDGNISFSPAVLGPMLEIPKGDVIRLQVKGQLGAMRIIDPSDAGLTIVVMPCKPRSGAPILEDAA